VRTNLRLLVRGDREGERASSKGDGREKRGQGEVS